VNYFIAKKKMIKRNNQTSFLLLLLTCLSIYLYAEESYLHQRPDQHKLSAGWQEPGLWRPKWIMEREFSPVDGKTSFKDRIYFRLRNDRTLKIIYRKNRPLIEMFKPRTIQDKKRKLFEDDADNQESEKDNSNSVAESNEKYQQHSNNDFDGTWWWKDESPLNQAKIKIETREGGNKERIRHDTRLEWGKLDGYAALFRRGKILKYKSSVSSSIPLSTYPAGTFLVKSTCHRPLVSKEFMAFQ
jgi:hypothetical protein